MFLADTPPGDGRMPEVGSAVLGGTTYPNSVRYALDNYQHIQQNSLYPIGQHSDLMATLGVVGRPACVVRFEAIADGKRISVEWMQGGGSGRAIDAPVDGRSRLELHVALVSGIGQESTSMCDGLVYDTVTAVWGDAQLR
jgi:hypothetical protein